MLKNNPVHATYRNRRNALQSYDPDGCFVFFGAVEKIRNNNAHYPFRQDSHFYYLTEFTESSAALVLLDGKSYLFVQDRIPDQELWTGERYGVDRARDLFGMDAAFSIKDLDAKLEEWLSQPKRIYFTLGLNDEQDQRFLKVLQLARRHSGSGRHSQLGVLDPTTWLAQMRMTKDDLELSKMRQATQITVAAHRHLIQITKPGMTEADLHREFQYVTSKNGGTDLGYQPIVASGWNATTLHYVDNNEVLKDGDLLLIDAGAEVDYYTADVTQTFPIGKSFSKAQAEIYNRVLSVNRSITAMMVPGTTYRTLHQHSVRLITDHLLSLGILSGKLEDLIQNKAYRPYYPHGVGHHLGLDVHDAALYDDRGRDFELKAGMVLTVEPGLYFRNPDSPYYKIGVRIEDDVLITEKGPEVLTAGMPRDVDAIEALKL
jgi:Xaa-Pro aminopeptidase